MGVGGLASVIVYLPCKHEALSSNPEPPPKGKTTDAVLGF
jgi:hypothetical protein